jgi:hypothetical protein
VSAETIRSRLLGPFCSMLDVTELSDGAFALSTPFLFPDGDGYPIVLERENGGWRFTDRGGAAGHLFFDDVDVTDYRLNFMRRAVERDGLSLSEDYVLSSDTYAEVPTAVELADFLQAVARVGSVTALERVTADRYLSTIRDQVKSWIPEGLRVPNWHPREDGRGHYPADLWVASERPSPVIMFFVASALKASTSTISLMQYREWGIDHVPVVAYKPRSLTSPSVFRLQNAVRHDEHVVPVSPGDLGYRGLRRVLQESGVAINGQ